MLLSNQKIDYSSVRRMPTVKLSGQTASTTTNTMPTSTSLQDISSHPQKFTWNDNPNDENKDQRSPKYSPDPFSPNSVRPISTSQSDERIFEHPEVTIKPSELDDELQKRLSTMKTSNTRENLLDVNEQQQPPAEPNILEHPDMRTPVVMQAIPSSSSSSFLLQNDCRRISRTQSADAYSTVIRTPSPGSNHRVEFFIDTQSNSKQSVSPGSPIDSIHQKPKLEILQESSIITVSTDEHSQPSSNSTTSLSEPNMS